MLLYDCSCRFGQNRRFEMMKGGRKMNNGGLSFWGVVGAILLALVIFAVVG